ncbi:MAG: dienelactone hydrolase family protein [Candidatus Latescibacteria bacterium]|nr:dienelactone hydrolase family protein [Candidatus Latescibacterota bacterium]
MAAPGLYYLSRPSAAPAAGGHPLLVLLHGYGSDERDLMGLVPYLDPRFEVVSVRGPQALEMGGYAWFAVQFTPFGLVLDHAQAQETRRQLEAWLEALVAAPGVDRGQVFLLGFSQGAGMALGAALHRPELVAGVAFISGLVVPQMIPAGDLEKLRALSVLMVHGRHDPLIPIQQGRASRALLEQLPLCLRYREYEMGHEINAECLEEVRGWLQEGLSPVTAGGQR